MAQVGTVGGVGEVGGAGAAANAGAGRAPTPPATPPPLPLWKVLLAEFRTLRRDCRGLYAAELDDPARSDAEQLVRVFDAVNDWSLPAGMPAAAGEAAAGSARGKTPALAALCFSGGGIRSATFNLGVLQGFAKLRLLDHFDYLSSVSGGGYIASWLAHWIKADGLRGVIDQLTERPADPGRPEPAPLTHLRQYSNYLTPRLGLLSADTWTMVAIVVRNMLLNWLVLLPLLAAPLLAPLLAVAIWGDSSHPRLLLAIAAALELAGLFFLSLLRTDPVARGTGAPGARGARGARGAPGEAAASAAGVGAAEAAAVPAWRRWYLRLGLLPRLAAIPPLLAAVACFAGGLPDLSSTELWGYCGGWALGLPLAALLASAPWLDRKPSEIAWDAFAVFVAGGVDAWVYTLVVRRLLPILWQDQHHLFVIFGPAVILGTMLIGRTVLVAASSVSEHWQSIAYGDADREWWARWSGWTLIVLLLWTTVAALVLFASTLLATARAEVEALVSAGGFGSLVALLGGSGGTPAGGGEGRPSRVKQLVLTLAAPLFVVTLILSLAWGGQLLLDTVWPTGDLARAVAQQIASIPRAGWVYVRPYVGTPVDELLAIGGLLLFGFLAGYPININRFSMQAGYRNRLIRAYPGASNMHRRPNLFTGFDENDNLPLADLAANRPLPVINMALNLVDGKDLAWQQRKAESFTATPLHCGAARLGYRGTREYGGQDGLSLGTAIATSGAAASPNMGLYTTSAAITFIMALFNVRLGIWLGNPRDVARQPTWRRSGPRFSARELVAEAFGLTDDRHPYVNLSDGGHFENLGLYEMVRRRCRLIVVCDAAADPAYAFDDLGNAIRKIRIDFGIPITFSGVRILAKQASGLPAKGARYCAIGKIDYGAVDANGATGTLVYFKPAICDGSPFDVENYARESQTFPHESTADQWFNETQFESYRALGEAAIQARDPGDTSTPADLQQYVERIERYLALQVQTGAATPLPGDAAA